MLNICSAKFDFISGIKSIYKWYIKALTQPLLAFFFSPLIYIYSMMILATGPILTTTYTINVLSNKFVAKYKSVDLLLDPQPEDTSYYSIIAYKFSN